MNNYKKPAKLIYIEDDWLKATTMQNIKSIFGLKIDVSALIIKERGRFKAKHQHIRAFCRMLNRNKRGWLFDGYDLDTGTMKFKQIDITSVKEIK